MSFMTNLVKYRQKQAPAKGLEMLSAAGWWGYATILFVVVLALVMGLRVMASSGAEATNLTTLATSTMNIAHTNSGYGSSTLNSVLYNSGVVPSSYTYTDGTIYNQWNGEVTVTGATSYFYIEDEGIPTSECVSITRSLASGGVASYLSVGGSKITSASDIAEIDSACGSSNSNVNGGTITITMYVGNTSGS